MAKYSPEDIRNVAFLGGAAAGKTTLVEALLAKLGAIQRRGNVADGSSSVDYDPEEKDKKHTLFTKVFHGTDKKHEFNLLDTPGYPDFVGEALSALGAVETCAVCVHAHQGPLFHTRKLWDEIGNAGRARVVVVTHMDAEQADAEKALQGVREAFGDKAVPVNYPVGEAGSLSGVVDILGPADAAPEPVKDQIATLREQLVETLVTQDEEVMEQYLESGEVADDVVARLLTAGMVSGEVYPVLFTAAGADKGIEELLRFLGQYAPSPLQGPFFAREGGEDGGATLDPNEHKAFVARVFKTVSDPFVGRLSYLRVLSGEIKTDDTYETARVGKTEKMGHILRPQGKEQETTDHAQAGDIVAVAKVETLETHDTLRAEKGDVVLVPIQMPKPMVARAITPKNRNEEQKMATALKKVLAEDPTLTMERDSQTGEMVLSGVSELHLNTALNRIKNRYKVEIETKIPRVPLRETITGKAEGHHRHKKQTGGRGQFGEVYLRIEPAERGEGFSFSDDTFGGSIPKQYIPAVEKGIVEQMQKGVVAGYPVVDVKVSVYDGKHHDVDSDEHSFRKAGARAFKDAFEKARPVLLEPIVKLEVAVHSRFMGDINSDLNSRRGRISGMDAIGDFQIIKADVPLKEVQTYAADLRSLTQGEGSFTYEFSHYDVVPPHVAEEFIKAHKAEAKEEED